MTVKAGQKCTAIRRAIVPSRCSTRWPRRPRRGWRRSSSATRPTESGADGRAGQPRPARGGPPLAQGAAVAPATVVFGDPEHVEVVGADAERGAFIVARAASGPTTPDRAEPHEVEAFGPVSTLIGYRDTDARGRAGRARPGQPGRLGRHRTTPAFAREVVLGVAPWHGRLLVLDRDDAAESTGHGSPLPVLVHGGPGRAGGGEELGGIRGVHAPHAAHRRPGSPARAGRDHRPLGAGQRAQRDDGVHPFRKSLAELRVGDSRRRRAAHGHRWRTSRTSPSSPATPSTRTPTPSRGRGQPVLRRHRGPRLPGRSRSPPGCSSTPSPGRCWPTTASTTCASSPRCTRATS